MRRAVLTLLTLALGCACGEELSPEPPRERLSLKLAPEDGIRGTAIRAIWRWNEARGCRDGSGCEFSVAEDGVPVRHVEEIIDPLTGERKGGANLGNEYVLISRTVANPERVLVHELGHRLGLDHMPTGIMVVVDAPIPLSEAIALEAYTINEETLHAACERGSCMEFNPEKAPH